MNAAKLLVVLGLSIAAAGLLLMLLAKTGVKPFRLPGDFVWRTKSGAVYFPVATSLLLSVLLTLLLALFHRR